MTITTLQYFSGKPHEPEQDALAQHLLESVNELLEEAERAGIMSPLCPNTGTQISGSKGGAGDGGFRLPTATTGSALSSHKEARAVDVYDPGGHLDDWLDDFEFGVGGNTKLAEYELYREAPSATPGWLHLTTRAPKSKRRTFQP